MPGINEQDFQDYQDYNDYHQYLGATAPPEVQGLPPPAQHLPTIETPEVQASVDQSLLTPFYKEAGGLGLSAAHALPFSDQAISAAAAGLQKLQGKSDFQPAYERYLSTARDTLKSFREENPVVSYGTEATAALRYLPVSKALEGLGIAPAASRLGRIAQQGPLGAAIGGLYGAADPNSTALSGAATGAILGVGLSGLIEGAGAAKDLVKAGATKIAPWLGISPEGANSLERSAFGLTKTSIKKSIEAGNRAGLNITGEEPIYKAIQDFRAAGGGAKGADAESLANDLRTQTQDLENVLSGKLQTAQAAQPPGQQIVPTFQKTLDFADSRSSSERDQALKIANEEINKFLGDPNNKGNILDWQNQKVKLGQTIANSYGREGVDNPLRVQILQKLRQDLRETIETSYEQLTGNPQGAAEIQGLNQELGKRYILEPVMTNLQAEARASDPIKRGMQLIRTSGGFGSLLTGAAIGHPFLGAAGAAGAFASSPRGKLALSDVLREGFPATTNALRQLPAGTARLATEFGSSGNQAMSIKGKPPSTPVIVPRETSGGDGKFNLDNAIKKYSAQFGLPEKLIKAQVAQESAGKADALSSKGAFGLMQLEPATAIEQAKKLGVTYDKNNPAQNIMLGTAYLAELKNRYNNLPLALAAYNHGLGNLDKLIAKHGTRNLDKLRGHLPAETQDYLKILEPYLA